MSSTLNNSRRPRNLHKAIGVAVAAAMLAGSLSACKTMENLSEKEKVLVAAGAGILAAIVGKAMQGGTMTAKSADSGSTQGSVLAAAKRAVAAGADAKALRQEFISVLYSPCGNHYWDSSWDVEKGCPCVSRAYAPAGASDRVEAAHFLLDNGMSVDQEGEEGSPLDETLTFLAQMNYTCGDYGSDTKTPSDGISKVATLLVSRGARDAVSLYGGGTAGSTLDATALAVAVKYGNSELASILIEKGANVNKEGECYATENPECAGVLELAAGEGRAEMVKLLLEKGAKRGRKKALAAAQSNLSFAETEAQKAQYREIISLLKAPSGKKGSATKRK